MKKFFLIIFLLICILGCSKKESSLVPDRILIGQQSIEYADTTSMFKMYGIYKQVFFRYNYGYKREISLPIYYYRDSITGKGVEIEAQIDEHGSLIKIDYIDLSNYPRREDPRFAD